MPEPLHPYCVGTLTGDTPNSRWILEPSYIHSAEIDEGTPIPLGVVVKDTGLYVLVCQCIDPSGRLGDQPVTSTALVHANIDITWSVSAGAGGFVTKVGGKAAPSARGEHVLYQPPTFDTTLVVEVTATMRRSPTDNKKPLNPSPTTTITFRIWLRTRADRTIIRRSMPRGSPFAPLPFCGTPGARLAATTRAFWEGITNIINASDPPDAHIPLDVIQHGTKIRYRVEPQPYTKAKAPRPSKAEGKCEPSLEFTPPTQHDIRLTIKTTALADACVKDMFLVEVEGEFPKRGLVTQCKSRGVCTPQVVEFREIEDVIQYRWRCSAGTILWTATGRTVIWQGDEGDLATDVTFNVEAYSILTGTPEFLFSTSEPVWLHAEWMKAEVAYIAFIDVNDVELPEPTFDTPCGGPGDPGSVYDPAARTWTVPDCVKWASLIDMYVAGPMGGFDVAWELLKRLRDLPEVFIGGHVYTYSASRWQLWRLPMAEVLDGDMIPKQSWKLVGERHPWRSAVWALKNFEANERPPEQFELGAVGLMRAMQRSRDFKHMAGTEFDVLRRRGRIVRIKLAAVFDEPGWSRYPGLTLKTDRPPFYAEYGTYQRGTRVEMPVIEISPLERESVTMSMDQTFTIGPRGNTLMAVMTNRSVPLIPVALRIVVEADSDEAKVIGDVGTGFPTLWIYKNAAGRKGVRRVEGRSGEGGVGQSKVPYMLEQGEQCVERGAQGL